MRWLEIICSIGLLRKIELQLTHLKVLIEERQSPRVLKMVVLFPCHVWLAEILSDRPVCALTPPVVEFPGNI